MATPEIKVIKLKVRRGTDAQRARIVLDEGELGYTTDTKRCFIGDGVTAGGIPVDNKHTKAIATYSSLPLIKAQKDDIVLVGTPPVAYRLTSSDFSDINNWSLFTHAPDNVYLEFNAPNKKTGHLTIAPDSIDANVMNTVSLSSETGSFSGDEIRVRYNSNSFISTPDGLDLVAAGIEGIGVTYDHIASSSFVVDGGIIGGDGAPIRVSVDGASIDVNQLGQLSVVGLPLTAVQVDKLKEGIIVAPVTGDISTVVQGVDGDTITLNDGILTVDFNAEGNITPDGYATPQTLTDNSIINWDASNGVNAIVTLTGDAHTLRDIINMQPGQSGILTVIQGGTGFYSLGLDNSYRVIHGDIADVATIPPGFLTKIEWDTHDGTLIYIRVFPETTF